MNPAWRFVKGDVTGAEQMSFDDSTWEVVSLPHGIEYLPTEASGCYNYQGVVWYRKHFTPDDTWKGRRLFLHFEAIMGKCRIYVNGELKQEHFGGYLPIVLDVTDALQYGTDNLIAVCADNSNDPTYPPGKAQNVLDFTYCGGIYRDCWLIAHNPVHITDPNFEHETASGGLFVAYDHVSETSADVLLKTHVRNDGTQTFKGTVEYELLRPDGTRAARLKKAIHMAAGEASIAEGTITLKNPLLWSPDSPILYNLLVRIKGSNGKVVDGYRQRIGIRSVEFLAEKGFYLNGKPYGKPLIGANRHQDFAVLGNALPNSIHWRDAKKLKDVGLDVIRNAHCPQDPAFMDACDELGLFILDNTPGWQFWNEEPEFAERVYDDIRNLVRRDRSHACLWLWEPILNETDYPADFAQNALQIVNEEYPYPYCYSGCDITALGAELYPVLFRHPCSMIDASIETFDSTKTYFTREWGDNPDDWNSQNSNSRVARCWGEVPMLVQADHYAAMEPDITNFDVLYHQTIQHIGGCLWHSFDHQRGYHPDPFYGGIMDAFRRPKFSYYMFMAQRPTEQREVIAETGPMVYIAHEMTPFSPTDVTVYSNCDEVRLTVLEKGKTYTYTKDKNQTGIQSPIITFPDVYNYMTCKKLSMGGYGDQVYMLAEGLIDGKVVATHKVVPARRPEKVILFVDDEQTGLKADGSDCVVIVAAVADRNGNIKRLNNDYVRFEIEGEGRLLGDASIMANPAPVKWGEAPILLQSTTTPGTITVRASLVWEGAHKATAGELVLQSHPADHPMVYEASEASQIANGSPSQIISSRNEKGLDKQAAVSSLHEVEQQQKKFGE